MATTATIDASLRDRHSDRQEAGGRRVVAAICRHTPGNVRVQREGLLVLNALPASQQTQSGAPGALAVVVVRSSKCRWRTEPIPVSQAHIRHLNKFLGALCQGDNLTARDRGSSSNALREGGNEGKAAECPLGFLPEG